MTRWGELIPHDESLCWAEGSDGPCQCPCTDCESCDSEQLKAFVDEQMQEAARIADAAMQEAIEKDLGWGPL